MHISFLTDQVSGTTKLIIIIIPNTKLCSLAKFLNLATHYILQGNKEQTLILGEGITPVQAVNPRLALRLARQLLLQLNFRRLSCTMKLHGCQ